MLKKISAALGAHIAVALTGFLTASAIIKIYGVTVFGLYIVTTSALGVFFGVSGLGVGVNSKRFLPAANSNREKAELFLPQFYFNLVVIIFFSTIFLMAFCFMGRDQPMYPSGVEFAPVYVIVYAVHSQLCDYFKNTRRIVIFSFGTAAVPVIFLLSVLSQINFLSLTALGDLLVKYILALSLVSTPLLAIVFRDLRQWRPRPWTVRGILLEARLGLPLVAAFLVDVALSFGDRYLVAALSSPAAAGAYATAALLASAPIFIPKAISVVLTPILARHVDLGGVEIGQKLVRAATVCYLAIAVPFVFGCALVGRDVLIIFADESVASTAWAAMLLVSASSVVYGLNIILNAILFVRLKSATIFKISCLAAIISVVLSFVALKLSADPIFAAIGPMAGYCLAHALILKSTRHDRLAYLLNKADFRIIFLISALPAVWVFGIKYIFDSPTATHIFVAVSGAAAMNIWGLIFYRKEIFDLTDVQKIKSLY